ncbi:MAG: hypothetical protein KDB60_09375 [Propionibacteriaceae bacterium]|nr:hypothetical protein [Propionibacteriaceae bacterium]
MLQLAADQIVALPVDDLALRVVADFAQSGWNQRNYTIEHQQNAQLSPPALRAIAGALSWAHAHGLIARSPTQNSTDAISS